MFLLQERVTKAASFTGEDREVRGRSLVIVLDVFSAERDSANETYDVYVTSKAGGAKWDIVHFPQIASTGVKRYVASVLGDVVRVEEVTTATPGVAANSPACIKVDTAAADEGIKTLTAGEVRHGAIGEAIGHELVVAGTVVTGIDYSITVLER